MNAIFPDYIELGEFDKFERVLMEIFPTRICQKQLRELFGWDMPTLIKRWAKWIKYETLVLGRKKTRKLSIGSHALTS